MARGIDITGQRFGRWLVLSRAGARNAGDLFWLCRCDCGTEREVAGYSLRKADSRSCGCLTGVNVAGRYRGPTLTVEQRRERGRARYHADKELIAARRKTKRSDPVLREKERAYQREYARTKVKRRYKYGITNEEFEAILAGQGGVCAICRASEPGGRGDWVLDHSHDFDRKDPRGWRGVLCTRCNVMLGMARDNEHALRAGAEYIRAWTQRQQPVRGGDHAAPKEVASS